MIPRRRLVGVGVLGGALSALVGETPAAASSDGASLEQGSEDRVAREITALRELLVVVEVLSRDGPYRHWIG